MGGVGGGGGKYQFWILCRPYNPDSFNCDGQDYGYYADVESACEVCGKPDNNIYGHLDIWIYSVSPPPTYVEDL